MTKRPLVSIVIRTKDRSDLLREALASLISQTHRPLEAIIVNDGGEDVSSLLEETQSQGISIHYIPLEKTRGRAAAGNAGLAAARGEWVGFLDDDDLLLPHAIETLLRYGKAAGAVYGKVELSLLLPDGTWKTLSVLGHPFSKEALLLCNYIPTCGFLFRRKFLDIVGGFDEEFVFLEDWDFIYRLSLQTPFVFVPEKVAVYRLFGRGYLLEVGENPIKECPWRARFYRKHWNSITPEKLATGYFAFLKIQGLDVEEERRKRMELEVRLSDSQRQISDLQQKLSDSQRQISDLQQKLRAVLSSRSWKITAPLRFLAGLLRGHRS